MNSPYKVEPLGDAFQRFRAAEQQAQIAAQQIRALQLENQRRELQIQEERGKACRTPATVSYGLTEGELQFLALMEQGERKTAVFAQALGIDEMQKEEREAIVKRTKGKLKKRMERGACRDDHAS